MANVTRIKASDPGKQPAGLDKPEQPKKELAQVQAEKAAVKGAEVVDRKAEKAAAKQAKKAEKAEKADKKDKTAKTKKPFILIRPFVALGTYLRDSWREIRQVRWPNRKATWKMVLAVIVYTALFMLLISLLDLFFTWLFSMILGN